MFSRIQTSIIFLLLPLLCRSAFNNASDPRWCWDYNCVKEESPGKICYYPAGNQTDDTFCSGGYSVDSSYETILETHLNQSLSIAYYSPTTGARLGGVNYSLSSLAPNTNVTLCLSGQVGHANEYQTMCEVAEYDNDITLPGSYCVVSVAQHFVSDGCYKAMPNSSHNGIFGLSKSDQISLGTAIPFGVLGVVIAGASLQWTIAKRLWPPFWHKDYQPL